VDALDRDALAVTLTDGNARLNRIDRVRSYGSSSSMAASPARTTWRCATFRQGGSSRPEALVRRLSQLVRPDGVVAVVVVEPLADLVSAAIAERGGGAQPVEKSRDYAVFHCGGTGPAGGPGAPGAGWLRFVRSAARFRSGSNALRHDDGLRPAGLRHAELEDQLGLEALEGLAPAGTWAFWRPGQGHLSTALLNRHKGAAASVTLGRTRPAVAGGGPTQRRDRGGRGRRVESLHLPFYYLIGGDFDFLAVSPDDDPGWRWQARFASDAARLVRPGGLLLVRGHSGPWRGSRA